VHGQAVWVKGRMIVPMYHPAAGLHQVSLKPEIEKDFLRLPEILEKSKQAIKEHTPPPSLNSDQAAKQLSLF
jgi:DNA polymerase